MTLFCIASDTNIAAEAMNNTESSFGFGCFIADKWRT